MKADAMSEPTQPRQQPAHGLDVRVAFQRRALEDDVPEVLEHIDHPARVGTGLAPSLAHWVVLVALGCQVLGDRLRQRGHVPASLRFPSIPQQAKRYSPAPRLPRARCASCVRDYGKPGLSARSIAAKLAARQTRSCVRPLGLKWPLEFRADLGSDRPPEGRGAEAAGGRRIGLIDTNQDLDLPHPALGQDLTPSPTARRAQVGTGVRARSARKGARVDRSTLTPAWWSVSSGDKADPTQ